MVRTNIMTNLLLASGVALSSALAQQYVISTVAGGAPPPTPAPGVEVPIGAPAGIAADDSGNVYFSNYLSVFKLDRNGILTRVAGNSLVGYSGDGGPATSAALSASSLAVDSAGNLFLGGGGGAGRVRRVSPDGIITTVAGNGTLGFSGDTGPATDAALSVFGVAVDGAGNLFIADAYAGRIRQVSPDGIITTVAGNGSQGFSGDNGPATSAQLNNPSGVVVDSAGNLFIADTGNQRIRKVSRGGVISTVAGDGPSDSPEAAGDGGPATSAQLGLPTYVALDAIGNLFIAENYGGPGPGYGGIREVSVDGIITTVAGGGSSGLGDDGSATSAQLVGPYGVAVDGSGNLFIADGQDRIRKVSTSGIITTVAGNGNCCFWGDGGPAINAAMSAWGVAVDGAGDIFIADFGNQRVREVASSGIITTVAGGGALAGASADDGPAASAALSYPAAVAVDGAGSLFIADAGNHLVRKVSARGIITTVAGNGAQGFSGDGGPATSAALSLCADLCGGLAVDSDGALFIADYGNNRIRKVSPDGIITTVAGSGSPSPNTDHYSGDGGPATNALLYRPTGVAVDSAGNIFVVDAGNNRIRKVSVNGIISTVAGNGTLGFSGDGGPATMAEMDFPRGVAVDSVGALFIADTNNYRIRMVSPAGIITTVAGGGNDVRGDGGPATNARLSFPMAVAVSDEGGIYIADNGIRLLRPANRTF